MNEPIEINTEILAWQPELRPALPCVYGPIDFREFRDQLITIDQLLDTGGVEMRFVRLADAEQGSHRNATARMRFAQASSLALRCNIARKLTGLDLIKLNKRDRSKTNRHRKYCLISYLA